MDKYKNNPNYIFEKSDKKPKRMGEGDFAGMPSKPKIMKFSNKPDMRGGLINSFTTNIEEISQIKENQ